MENRIYQFIKRIRNRLMTQEIIRSLHITLLIGAGLALIISVMSLFVPMYYAPHAEIAAIILSVIAGIIWGIRRSPDMRHAALAADAKGNKEKLVTALELRSSENPYKNLLLADADASIRNFSVRKQFPLRISVRKLVPLLLLVILLAASTLTDSLVRTQAAKLHAVKAQAAETLVEIEKVEQALSESDTLSQSELAEYLDQLEVSKKELSDVESMEDLLKAQERLTQKLKTAGNEIGDTELAKTVSESAAETNSQAADSREALIKEAQEALAAAENGTEEEKQNAYEKLSELASAVGDDALQAAANQYQSSNYSSQSYAAAKTALNQTTSDLSSNTAIAGNSQNSSDTNGTSSNASSSTGTSGSSGEGSSDGGGWNYGSNAGTESSARTDESITIPDAQVGDDENLTGQSTDSDSSTYTKSNESSTWAGSKVSYGSVSSEYKEKAYAQLDSASYPDSLKTQIRNYFDGLN